MVATVAKVVREVSEYLLKERVMPEEVAKKNV